MTPRAAVLFVSLAIAAPLAARADDRSGKSTFWVVPHTHWEGAVFKTREEYLEMGLPNILKAMKVLNEQPSYHFVLDQAAYVRPFLERYPEQEADFRRFLKEGRLELVGGLDVMPDVNIPGGETFVRQIQYGKGYYRRKLGVDVTSAWLIDTFGHHAQIPQLLSLGGYRSFWFSRGVPKPDHPSEFLWEGIDGTKIPAFWLPHNYGLLYGSAREANSFRSFIQQRYAMLDPNSYGKDRVGLSGVDVNPPEEHLAAMIEAYNRELDAPLKLRLAVPSKFEAVVARRTDRLVFRGELNPIFQGIYSSRIELKQWMRRLESRLLTAEKLASIAGPPPSGGASHSLWRAWEPVLFNETHDLASGVMTDHVYEDTIRGFEFSDRLAGELIETGWNALTARADTSGAGIPVVVFNPLGWSRTDIAEVDVGFGVTKASGVRLKDEAGKEVPVQIVGSSMYGDGMFQTARVAFVAAEVPSIGYRVYHLEPAPADPGLAPSAVSSGTVETPFYQIGFDTATGAIASLRVKDGDWEAFTGPAGVVARQEDKGDLWELYQGLDGASKIAMTNRQAVPTPGRASFSHEFRGTPGTIASGPVFSELRVAHPFGSGIFAETIRVYQQIPRIDCELQLVNKEKYVRYQALFPTSIEDGKSVHEIPFGAIERPEGVEFPAQNWADLSNARRGVAILNIGLPGNVATKGTMMVSLLRAHTLGAYGFGGGYEPGMSSDTGFQLGKTRTMRYAIVPHNGDWRSAGLFRQGLELNHHLIARSTAPHTGDLPRRWCSLRVSAPNVVITAVEPASGGRGIAVRAYEAAGQPARDVTLTASGPLASAVESNLLGDPIRPLPVSGSETRLEFRPFEIKTIVIKTNR